jgi:hypothetical protein
MAGLLIGAVISFCALAVASMVATADTACDTSRPDGWLIRAEVPWEQVTREVASVSVPVAGATLGVTEVEPGQCGRMLVRADWTGAALRLPGVGVELDAGSDASELSPVQIHFGSLSLPLGWLPGPWREQLGLPLAEMGGAVLSSRLQGEGMNLCGLVGEPAGLVLYLCGDAD